MATLEVPGTISEPLSNNFPTQLHSLVQKKKKPDLRNKDKKAQNPTNHTQKPATKQVPDTSQLHKVMVSDSFPQVFSAD